MNTNENHLGVINITRKSFVLDNVDAGYADDGFFSDVPGGTLSKSMHALNKYVKKNLLNVDDYEEDNAYFTKDNSPNESISKYDSDSVKSNESEKRELLSNTRTITDKPHNEPEIEIGNSTLTDDYKIKSLHLLDKPTENLTSVVSNAENNNTDHLKQTISTSLADLSIHCENNQNDHEEHVVYREKRNNEKYHNNRHTVHDIDWVNRATVYPDVYAPLPYSKLQIYVFCVLKFSFVIETVQ
jgi:hypothetical protein